ncbi:MAG: fructose-bisphosphate aldolase class I [Patescibacteria group bacterium]|nr:fructose-bisphosphate aldolase class I [Patescibacteria group bacterium]MDE1965916.1 fructose-bisphosphate aldolase class I [Patescibacteria group bacterium]
MHDEQLKATANRMVANGKGLLAADESNGTIGKRFEAVGVENTHENRRAYRELLFTAPDIAEGISGVIMYDETFRDTASTGASFVSLLESADVLPGIKVDEGTEPMDGSPEEKVTKGLESLSSRMPEYAELGAKFAKWRAVITIGEGIPTDANLTENARRLAAYAKICQENGIVPIVEPEVLMDWSNGQAECEAVSERNLTHVFAALRAADVLIEGMILKTNMMVPGKESGETKTPEEVAEATLRVFTKVLPPGLPGQMFLSGGQSELEATENLAAMHARGPLPWKLSFSYGRALQKGALEAWRGMPENVPAAQAAFLHRAKMNRLAALGRYTKEAEAKA